MPKNSSSTPQKSTQQKSARKSAARVNDVSPQAAIRLAEMAAEMRELAFGGNGVPEWGTRFTEIENSGMNVGLELARLFMEQSVSEQAEGDVPADQLKHEGETATPEGQTKQSQLETPAGEVGWEQPKTRLEESRRDFFPSGESIGN